MALGVESFVVRSAVNRGAAMRMMTLGVLLVDTGDTKRGLDLLRQAAAAAPQASGIRINLVKALAKAGKQTADELKTGKLRPVEKQ